MNSFTIFLIAALLGLLAESLPAQTAPFTQPGLRPRVWVKPEPYFKLTPTPEHRIAPKLRFSVQTATYLTPRFSIAAPRGVQDTVTVARFVIHF